MEPLIRSGNKLMVGETEIRLVGVNVGLEMNNMAGGQYFKQPGFNEERAIRTFDEIKSYGANCVRLGFALRFWWDNTTDPTSGLQFRDILHRLVKICEERDIYVILMCYCLEPSENTDNSPWGRSFVPDQYTFAWIWAEISEHMLDCNNVLIDPKNEPQMDVVEWFSGLQTTINAIRAKGSNAIVLIQYNAICWVNMDYPQSRNDLSWVFEHPINDNQIIISTHLYRYAGSMGFYVDSHGSPPNVLTSTDNEILQAFSHYNFPAVADEYPLIIGEIGCSMSGGQIELDNWKFALGILNDLKVHYCAWIWKDEDDDFRLFDNYANPLGSINASGTLLKAAVTEITNPEPEPTKYICSICGAVFTSQAILDTHILDAHTSIEVEPIIVEPPKTSYPAVILFAVGFGSLIPYFRTMRNAIVPKWLHLKLHPLI